MNNAVRQRIMYNQSLIPKNAIRKVEESINVKSDLSEVKGVWPATLIKFLDKNITTKEQLSSLSENEIKEIVWNPLASKKILSSLNK